MSGKEIRLGRLFSRGKVVIVAVDHGGYMGPIEGIEDLPEKIELFRAADAILVNPNMAKCCGRFFSSYNSPLMIVRVNWGSHYCPNFKEGYGNRMATVRQAVALGADMVVASFLLGGKEEAHVENVTLLGEIFEETEALGIPLVGEFIPMEGVLGVARNEELVRLGVRMCAEIGADLIKTVNIPGFSRLVTSIPIPVLALGGAKMDSELEALKFAQERINEGAAGVVYGRNVFQAEDPKAFLEALIEVVREGKDPRDLR